MSDSQAKIEDEADVNRLHDILVHEVSLVDRAANKRKFLMLKRGEEMADQTIGAEVVETEDGKLTTIEETNKSDALVIPNDAKAEITQVATKALALVTQAAELIKDADDDTAAKGIPADIAKELDEARNILFAVSEKYTTVDDEARKGIAPTDKASTIRMATESLERLAALVEVVAGADGVEKSDDGVPAQVTGELMAVARLVSGLIERYTAEPEPTSKSWADVHRTIEKAAPAVAPVAEVSDAPKADALDTLSALAKAAEVLTPVSKAGRKMSSDRLGKLRSIAKELIELLREVSPDDFDEMVTQAAKNTAAKKAAPKDPTKPETDVVAKSDLAAAKSEIEKAKTDLAKATADLKAARASVARFNKSFDLPNSMTEEVLSKPKQELTNNSVAWPADMNRPVTKDSVKKGHWFDPEE